MEITGIVDRIIFRNAENGYTVLSLRTDSEEGFATLCGTLPLASPGEQLRAEGTIKYHPKYGQQFMVTHAETLAPSTQIAIENYLAGGTVKGVGPAMARLIVDRFGMDTLQIMEKQPERLLEVPGIGRKKLEMIMGSFRENRSMRDILMALAPYGITVNQAYRMYKTYGDLALAKVQENPYQLIDDIDGIGFMTADAIAQRVAGFETNSAARLFAGIKYALQDAKNEYGHTYLPAEKDTKNNLAYEWTRYASLPDVRIAGGMGKVLNQFLSDIDKHSSPNAESTSVKPQAHGTIEVMSYSDNEWSNGDAYRKLGFKLAGTMEPVTYRIDPKTWKRINPRQWAALKTRLTDKEAESYTTIQNQGSRKWVFLFGDGI